ncbi:hypothetical protein EYR38_009572 [Pleurotus pulmonarius]|nr:hypothetical protein EYR38_009572 [Pleurotus pulmonarius]
MGGTSTRNFRMFRKLCGDDSLQNVVLVTNMWGQVPFDIGEAREQELKEQDIFFKPVLDEGAQIKRHNNTLASTQEILRSVAFKGTVPLRIQKELVDEKKDITDTDAGEELGRELHEQAVKFKQQQEKLREEMEEALKNNDEKARVELEKATAKLNEDINRLTSDSARMASSFADAQRRMQQELAEARSSRGGFFSHLGPPNGIWATMRQGAPFLHKYANDLFDTVAETNKDVAARVNIIKALLQAVEDDVQEFHKSFRVLSPGSSEASTLGQISEDIDRAFEEILKRVHEAFPALDEAAHHEDRQRFIERLLSEAEIELFEILCMKHKLVDEEAFRRFWRGVSPIVERIVVTTGDLVEQHPKLTAFVVTGVIFMLIPESWFTKPLLRLIGFGPLGPVKGEYIPMVVL